VKKFILDRFFPLVGKGKRFESVWDQFFGLSNLNNNEVVRAQPQEFISSNLYPGGPLKFGDLL